MSRHASRTVVYGIMALSISLSLSTGSPIHTFTHSPNDTSVRREFNLPGVNLAASLPIVKECEEELKRGYENCTDSNWGIGEEGRRFSNFFARICTVAPFSSRDPPVHQSAAKYFTSRRAQPGCPGPVDFGETEHCTEYVTTAIIISLDSLDSAQFLAQDANCSMRTMPNGLILSY